MQRKWIKSSLGAANPPLPDESELEEQNLPSNSEMTGAASGAARND
jgi:hypothetical protein